jgi:ABC-type transport system involved in multi-copper enzyme maturation permease subunit
MGGIVLSVLSLYEDNINLGHTDSGSMLFLLLAFLQLLLMSFVLPGVTSGLISGERERQTLDILLTTSLSSRQIVFSKWLASLSFILLLFISSFPIYVIVFLYGGIPTDYLWKVILHFLVTIIFMGSLGMFCSAFFKRTGIATVVTYVTVAVIGIGLLILLYLLVLFQEPNLHKDEIPIWIEIICGLHPVISLYLGLVPNMFDLNDFIWKIHPYPFYLLIYVVFSVLLLVGATYYLSPVRFRLWKTAKKKQV